MTPPENRKRRWISLAWYLIGFGVFLLLARFLYYHGKPERVGEMSLGVSYGTHPGSNGQVYWVTDTAEAYVFHSVIHARSLTGGPERQIVQEAPQYMIEGVTVTDQGIYYGLVDRAKTTPFDSAGGSSASTIAFEGTFRAVVGKPYREAADHETRRPLRLPYGPDVGPLRIRRVPLTGGTPQDLVAIATSQEGAFPRIVGDYAYWIKARPDDAVEVRSGNRSHYEVTGHSDLMVTPLQGGPSHCLTTGLEQSTSLSAGTDGVYWMQPRVYPDRTRDLYHMRASDLKPQILAGFTGQTGVTEYQGRLYWAVSANIHDGSPDNGDLFSLDSLRLDGSDRRTVFLLAETGMRLVRPPTPYRGHLYFIVADVPTQTEAQPDRPKPLHLYRILPEQADAVEMVRALPAQIIDVWFVDGYLYFTVGERHRGIWASLTNDTMGDTLTRALFRVPLAN